MRMKLNRWKKVTTRVFSRFIKINKSEFHSTQNMKIWRQNNKKLYNFHFPRNCEIKVKLLKFLF